MENLLESELAGHTFHLADVTHGRVIFSIQGAGMIELLNRACSLDFHPRVFKPGQCVRTRFAQISALIHLSPNGDEFVSTWTRATRRTSMHGFRPYVRYSDVAMGDAGGLPELQPAAEATPEELIGFCKAKPV